MAEKSRPSYRTTIPRLCLVSVVLIGSSLSLSACGTSKTSAMNQLTRTILEGGSSPAYSVTLSNAEQSLTASCMSRKGFKYFLQFSNLASVPNSIVGPEFGANLAERRVNGYGIYESMVRDANSNGGSSPRGTLGNPSTDPEDAYLRGLTGTLAANYNKALFGTETGRKTYSLIGGTKISYPTTGCFATARRMIYGSIANYVTVFDGLPVITDKIEISILSNGEYKATLQKWSACMAKLGLRYSSPTGVQQKISEQYVEHGLSQKLHSKEIETSVYDLQCANQTKLEATYRGALTQSAENVSGALQREGLLAIQLENEALRRANRELSG